MYHFLENSVNYAMSCKCTKSSLRAISVALHIIDKIHNNYKAKNTDLQDIFDNIPP